jgi:hypothetical protein
MRAEKKPFSMPFRNSKFKAFRSICSFSPGFIDYTSVALPIKKEKTFQLLIRGNQGKNKILFPPHKNDKETFVGNGRKVAQFIYL